MPKSFSKRIQGVRVLHFNRRFRPHSNSVRIHTLKRFRVNIRKQKESQTSTLLRIMTNYLQVIGSAMSFNLVYPTYLIEAMKPSQFFGETSETLLSFDCFFSDSKRTHVLNVSRQSEQVH